MRLAQSAIKEYIWAWNQLQSILFFSTQVIQQQNSLKLQNYSQHIYTQIQAQTSNNILKELVPFILPLLKKHIKLGLLVTSTLPPNSSIPDFKKIIGQKEWTDINAYRQTAVPYGSMQHLPTTNWLFPAAKQAIQKAYFLMKSIQEFPGGKSQENGQLAEKKDKTERATGVDKQERLEKCNQMNALRSNECPKIPDKMGDIRCFWPPFEGSWSLSILSTVSATKQTQHFYFFILPLARIACYSMTFPSCNCNNWFSDSLSYNSCPLRPCGSGIQIQL